MSIKKGRNSNIAAVATSRGSVRFSLALLMVASLVLITMNKAENPSVLRFRSAIIDVLSPVISVISKPASSISNIGIWMSEMVNLRAENIYLKNANSQLLQWQTLAKNLEAENHNLRMLMNALPDDKNNYITARIVTDTSGPYVRSALIEGGDNQGIKKNLAVISEAGLVGRTIEVADNNSRILLIDDINSRVPVMGESSREKSIMVGNNSKLPTLSYISTDSKLKVGERIITSGDGGIFPYGIAVGVITEIRKNKIVVQPFINGANIEYVSIIENSL
ncbi:MAG: rod shape-determining protein MreC [Rickettsiales bacterium]